MALAVIIVGVLAVVFTNVRYLIVGALKLAVELLVTFWKWSIIALLLLMVFCYS